MSSDIELKLVDKPPPWLSAAVTVEPGDVLVILLPEHTTPEMLDQLAADLHRHRPDLKDRLLFVGGATGLAVLKAQPAESHGEPSGYPVPPGSGYEVRSGDSGGPQ